MYQVRCKNQKLHKEYYLEEKKVKESLKKCDVLFVNVDENDDIRGFATILFDEIGIYIDTICVFWPLQLDPFLLPFCSRSS